MYECNHCIVVVARAILGRGLSPVVHSSQRAVASQARRSVQARSFSTKRLRSSHDDESIPFDAATKKLEISPVPRRHLELELKWLPDRVKFAERIRALIYEEKDVPKALALLRFRSKPSDPSFATVAWNHIINYHLNARQSSRAFELFNDMKKRGQCPDTVTYMFLLKGTVSEVDKHKKPSSVQMDRVIHILESMFAKSCKVEPTAAHVDAALKAVESDLSKVWKILELLPEERDCAATSTYTAILHAIKESIYTSKGSADASETTDQARIDAVERARDLWTIVFQAWQAGKIRLDSGIVTSIAGVLLRSPRLRDWDDVFNLANQTAQVPRQLEPLVSAQSNTAHIPSSPLLYSEGIGANSFLTELKTSEGQVKTKRKVKPKHINPDAQLLAVVLKACLAARVPKAAIKYWQYFIGQRAVVPDVHAINTMLLICTYNRTSARAAELCSTLEQFKIQPNGATFELAIKTCQRNWKAERALSDASSIIDTMSKLVAIPDVQVLQNYVSLALTSDNGDKIVQAVHNIDNLLLSVRSILKTKAFPVEWSPALRNQYISDALQLYSALVGAFDTLMQKNMVPREQFGLWHARRKDTIKLVSELRKQVDPALIVRHTDSRSVARTADGDGDVPMKRPLLRTASEMQSGERSGAFGMSESRPYSRKTHDRRSQEGKTPAKDYGRFLKDLPADLLGNEAQANRVGVQ